MKKLLFSNFYFLFSKTGQSLVEILVALGVGTILIIGATGVIIPSLRANTQADKIQVSAALGKELIENTRAFSEGDWHNISNLATSSANKYFLVPGSPFIAATGTEGVISDGITSGLVGYWKLDESTGTVAYDFSGNGNNGTLINSPTNVTGKVSQGLSFDGSTNYISVSSSTSLQPLAGNWSVSFWIYRLGTGAGDYPEIIGSRPWTTGTDKGWAVSWSSNNSKIGAHYADGSVGFDVTATQSTSTVPLTTWQHWVVVFDKTNGKLNYYLNGQLDFQQSPAFPSGTINQADNLYMGVERVSPPPARKLNAILDEVRAYNRALSATEVKTLYSSTIYTRYFYIDNVGRDASGNILSSGGTNDPSTKKLTAVYGWPNGPTNSFSTYLTRFQNNVFDQTDWSGGPGQDGPATTTNSRFSTSTQIYYATTTGSILIQLQ